MKKVLLFAFAALVACASLAGCSPTPLSQASPVTLTMWHNYGGDMQHAMDLLIDEFNSTVGAEEGIVINVTAISSSAELNKSLSMIANDDPGAPDMPDIFTGYPKVAVQFFEKGMLCNLDEYFTPEELESYVPAFLEEGRLDDGGLYVFPLAKSTEILYLNQTLFNEFSAATGASESLLASFEGIAELAAMYYEWTDEKTAEPGDGKEFFAADSWFNVVEVGMRQLGADIFNPDGSLALDSPEYVHIYSTLHKPAAEGGFAIYDGYSSDLSKTGDLVCSTGSSAGILFYGDTITYPNGTVKDVEYSILPYPVWEGGSNVALQRGGGLMVAKTDGQREYAAAIFLKWLTAAGQNMAFVAQTGYLPVTRQAFEEEMPAMLGSVEDERVRRMLQAVLGMYENYEFFFAPNYSNFDEASSAFEQSFKLELAEARRLARGQG